VVFGFVAMPEVCRVRVKTDMVKNFPGQGWTSQVNSGKMTTT
jgi:hypothetical protein